MLVLRQIFNDVNERTEESLRINGKVVFYGNVVFCTFPACFPLRIELRDSDVMG